MTNHWLRYGFILFLLLLLGLGAPDVQAQTDTPVAPANACGPRYVVQPGDWLWRIARRCNTTLDALLAANSEISNPNLIFPRQVLQIPADEPAPQVSITPDQGEPGTGIQVNAIGFAPNAEVRVGLGRSDSEPTVSRTVVTGREGALETSFTLPAEARPGAPWVVLVSNVETGQRPSPNALS